MLKHSDFAYFEIIIADFESQTTRWRPIRMLNF